jgi:hypothetical protein
VWKGGAELVIAESSQPWGPFSFVAASREFGPSNGYGAGFPSQWISADGRTLWLKWAANFAGCRKGLDCSGAYGFNVAQVRLTTPAKAGAGVPSAKATGTNAKVGVAPKRRTARKLLYVGLSVPLLLLLVLLIRPSFRDGLRHPSGDARDI